VQERSCFSRASMTLHASPADCRMRPSSPKSCDNDCNYPYKRVSHRSRQECLPLCYSVYYLPP
jgi:hypothetical protein